MSKNPTCKFEEKSKSKIKTIELTAIITPIANPMDSIDAIKLTNVN